MYMQSFSVPCIGAPGLNLRIELGVLIIKEKLGIRDRETVEKIKENPYLKQFLALKFYNNQETFDTSMLFHFREGIGTDLINKIN